MEWSSFWASFKSTIEDRKELSNTQRLNYLRQAVKDPDLQLLLHSPAETPDCSGKNHIFTEQPTSAAQQADYHLSPSSLSTIGVIPLNSLSISSSIPSSITCSRTNNYIMHFSYSSVFGQFLYACLFSSSNQITHILTPCIAHSAYK